MTSRGRIEPTLLNNLTRLKKTRIISELIQYIFLTSVLTKFQKNWTKHVTFGVLRRKTSQSLGGYVFKPIRTIFELVKDTVGTIVLTKMHADWKIDVAFGVLTR
ncbi:hypothetical protein DPMN_086375 [Dreissena polymorpha]|uniref:Uncharacterized protein n=1 Tax=Dreissena polymorpha TaxID=45954 RepID=A0A9D4KRR6_DREPO|nr:hypothetical protein DPMN_086375 [Dreissena polymorpha]